MRRLSRLIVLLMIVAALSCATQPRTIKHYSKDGISFSHYSDWTISKDASDEDDPNSRSIELDGPDEALVMFICLPPSMSSVTAADFADSMDAGRQELVNEKYKVGIIKPFDVSETKSSPIVETIGGKELDGVVQRFSVKVLGQDVPHESRVYAMDSPRYRIFIVTQVAVEDLTRATPAFNLTLNSFLATQ